MAILRSRLSATGVEDGHVAVYNGEIVVTVPGTASRLPADIAATARMYFRPVLAATLGGGGASGGASAFGVTPELQAQFAALDCASNSRPSPSVDPTGAVVACAARADSGGVVEGYLLGPAAVDGADLASVDAKQATGGMKDWVVALKFTSSGKAKFTSVTGALANGRYPTNRFAITLDEAVVVAPAVNQELTGGEAEISGFGEDRARLLAAQLRFGSLPLPFIIVERSTVPAAP